MQQATSLENVQQYKANSIVKNYSSKTGAIEKYMNWAQSQEKNSFVWLAVAILGTIGAVLPLTLYAVINCGNNFTLWIITCSVNVPVLALNLAAQPPKVTLPFLFFAWLTDFAIIAYCVVTFFFIR